MSAHVPRRQRHRPHVCSHDARTPPSVFDVTPDDDLQPNGGPCVLWICGDIGSSWFRWIFRADFAFDGAPDMLGRVAAFVAKVVKTVVGQHRSLLGGNYNLGNVRVRFPAVSPPHLAYPTQDGLSAMPHTFPCPTPRNRETVPHRICLEPRLNLWCPEADYAGHFDHFWGKKAS